MSSAKKQIFITGGAGGLGRAMVDYFVARDWHVFVGVHKSAPRELENHPGVTLVPADVSNSASIEAAAAQIGSHTDGLDGIVNLAGVTNVAALVEISDEAFMHLLNVNVLGTYRVNKTCLPLVLKRKGRIINVSSEVGWQSGMPFNGAYASSKHALEAYNDALRRELMFLDVPVIKIQPGAFKTEMTTTLEANFGRAVEETRLFKPHLKRMHALVGDLADKAQPPNVLAKVVHHAMTTPRPKPAYAVNSDLFRTLLQFLPARWVDQIFLKILQ
jgi:NAD(P)-dependent dehydrogenase (short-subunit alcohol dehydrogenase family)